MPGSSRVNLSVMIEGVLCTALAVLLSKLNMFALPQGGSVDLELVPLLFFSCRRGLKWGCCFGALTGLIKILIKIITGADVIGPLQAVIDYPMAYACTGLAALFSNLNKGQLIGTILAAFAQTACHSISGAVFFAQYAPAGQNPWTYAIAYNAPIITLKYAISSFIVYLFWKAVEASMPKVKKKQIANN